MLTPVDIGDAPSSPPPAAPDAAARNEQEAHETITRLDELISEPPKQRAPVPPSALEATLEQGPVTAVAALPPAPTVIAPLPPISVAATALPEAAVPTQQTAEAAPSTPSALPAGQLAAATATAATAATAGPSRGSTSEDLGLDQAVHDIVLRSPSSVPRVAGSTSLAATIEILGSASTIDDLHALLQSECVKALSGAQASGVDRCVRYVAGLAREEERVLCGWPVLSINEWGVQQVRTLVLTSHAVYRVAFSQSKGNIDHYTRTSLGNCKLIERGRCAFKLHLTEPDGRENPITYFWCALPRGLADAASHLLCLSVLPRS
jgi:hypothetical protein